MMFSILDVLEMPSNPIVYSYQISTRGQHYLRFVRGEAVKKKTKKKLIF